MWKPIPDFPGYSVSDYGRVRSDKSERILSQFENQSGLICVGMVRAGIQRHRSVPLLVAKAFLPNETDIFNTPINLDGDRHNNAVWNLAWRPRWFAIKYHQQFENRYEHPIETLIEDIDTGEVSNNSFECAMQYGLLEHDLVLSILNDSVVWPTYQVFRVYQE